MIRRSRLVLEDEEGCAYDSIGVRYTTRTAALAAGTGGQAPLTLSRAVVYL
jgi:hypothetical protein